MEHVPLAIIHVQLVMELHLLTVIHALQTELSNQGNVSVRLVSMMMVLQLPVKFVHQHV